MPHREACLPTAKTLVGLVIFHTCGRFKFC
jgi:hypothetical protein